MIKKVIAFLALLGVGYLGLHLAIGGENFANVRDDPTTDEVDREPPRGGVPVRDRDSDREMVVRFSKGLHIYRYREVEWNGKQIKLPEYDLQCLDSEPLDDNLQQLDEVWVKLYEHGEQAGEQPTAVHTMDLMAVQALVELSRDDRGQPTIRQDKEMVLNQMVWRANQNSRMPGTQLEVESCRFRATEGENELHTPTDRELVILDVTGERPVRLTGRGLQARLPGGGARGAQRIYIEINHDPVISTDGGRTRLEGDQRLKYVENTEDGGAVVTIERNVKLTAAGNLSAATSAPAQLSGTVEAKGDRLAAWLRRIRFVDDDDRERNELRWLLVTLEGSPATLTGTGFSMRCSNLSVVPDANGGADPLMFSASGAGTQMVYTDPKTGAETTFTAARKIHLLRPAVRLVPTYRSFGFPVWALGRLRRLEVVIFEGQASVAGGDQLGLQAERGLWLIRDTEDEDSVTMRGLGQVSIERPDPKGTLVVEGNQGFFLRRTAAGEELVLGPSEPSPDAAPHRYEIRRGDLSLTGTGSCTFVRHADESVEIELHSGEPSIAGEFGAELGSLSDATDVVATLAGEQLKAFDARGPATTITWRRDGQEVIATAGHVEQLAADAFRLTGTSDEPAVVGQTSVDKRGQQQVAKLTAPVLDIYRLGERSVLLDAAHPAGAHMHLTLPATGDRPGLDADLQAKHLRVLPFAVPSTVLDLHAAALPAGVRQLFAVGLRGPVLLADRAVRIEQGDKDGEHSLAEGTALALALTGEAGLLTGDPATGSLASLHRQELDGRELHADAPAIAVQRIAGGERLLLAAAFPGAEERIQPRLVLSDQDVGDVNLGSSTLAASCDGPIEVLPDRIDCLGPVHVQSLRADGEADPEGIDLVAQKVTMARDPATGEIQRIEAGGEVELQWSRVRGRADQLVLDLQRSLCTVIAEPGGYAQVWLPSLGELDEITARRAEVNYETMRISVWNSRAIGRRNRPGRGAPRR